MAETADVVETVKQGYAFEGAAIELGALLVDDEPKPEAAVRIPLSMVNRHGLVAGATGTGKTKTLQLMAEQLSAAGVAVFAADIKGDLSGISQPGEGNDKLLARTKSIGQDWTATGVPDRVLRARRAGHRDPDPRHDHVVRAGAAVQGAGAERRPGVLARAGLPLRRQGRPAAARPQGPARGHPATSRPTRARTT